MDCKVSQLGGCAAHRVLQDLPDTHAHTRTHTGMLGFATQHFTTTDTFSLLCLVIAVNLNKSTSLDFVKTTAEASGRFHSCCIQPCYFQSCSFIICCILKNKNQGSLASLFCSLKIHHNYICFSTKHTYSEW